MPKTFQWLKRFTATMAGPAPATAAPATGSEGPPVCRICLDAEGALIQPCGCQGSMRWVHAECLAQWWHHRYGVQSRGVRGGACGNSWLRSLEYNQCGYKHIDRLSSKLIYIYTHIHIHTHIIQYENICIYTTYTTSSDLQLGTFF